MGTRSQGTAPGTACRAPYLETPRSAARARQRGHRQPEKRERNLAASSALSFKSAHQQVSCAAMHPKLAPQTGHVLRSGAEPADGAFHSLALTTVVSSLALVAHRVALPPA